MSIYQFGKEYIHDDGAKATSEEIEDFELRQKALKLQGEISKAMTEAESKKWHEMYDATMFEFFWDSEEEWKDLIPDNEDDLIYQLSTAIFDGTDDYGRDHVMSSEIVGRIKKTFPAYWERAVEGYFDHNHDT